jgi:hypothetical protein
MLGKASALTGTTPNPYNGPSNVGASGQNSQTYANGQVAGSTALQNQAYGNIANMQQAGQINQGSNIANNASTTASNMGNAAAQIGTVGGLGYGAQGAQAGGMGVNMGVQGAGYGAQGQQSGLTGQNIGQSVAAQSQNSSTGPGSVGSYMNPYLQQSLAPQEQLLNQQYGIQGQQEQGQATGAGAFGGSREALMSGLNQQNQDLAMNQLVSSGYNTAFSNAQNQMNTAAGLGMQGTAQGITGAQAGIAGANTGIAGAQAGIAGANTGLAGVNTALQGAATGIQGQNTALSGANTLGTLGQDQYTQNAGITQAQLTAGTQQQALNQNIASTDYSTYQNQLNAPYNQLGFMSNIVSGVPTGGATSQVYQAPATAASQVASAGLGAYGITQAFGKKGGKVKRTSVGKKNMGEGLAKLGLQKAMARRS